MAGGDAASACLARPWASSPNDIKCRLFLLRPLAQAVAIATLQACAAGAAKGTQQLVGFPRFDCEGKPPGAVRPLPDGIRFPVRFPWLRPCMTGSSWPGICLRLGGEQILD